MSREKHCADHCTSYSLSDPKNTEFKGECKHKHDVECEQCESLEEVLKDIKDKINNINIDEEQRKRINFDYNQHEEGIKAWKAHLVWTVLQEEAKQAALDKLDDETCLIIVDWAIEKLHVNSSAIGNSAGTLVQLLPRRIVVLKSSALCIFSIFTLRTITQLHRYLSIYFKPLKQSTKASAKHL